MQPSEEYPQEHGEHRSSRFCPPSERYFGYFLPFAIPWSVVPLMGTSHAATGLLTGGVTGLLLSDDLGPALVCAAIGAGAALLPDLDTPGSTAGRSLGAVTELLAGGTRSLSKAVYVRTATEVELAHPQDGGHRFLTHTVPACLLLGVFTLLVALVPLGAGLVVFAMGSLGLGAVLRDWRFLGSKRKRRITAVAVAGLFGVGTMLVEGWGPPWWLVGLTVFVGALTHVFGDWLTRSGVPLAWPFVVRGKRWWMFRSPVAFHTGKSPMELVIKWGSVCAFPLLMLLGTPATPTA